MMCALRFSLVTLASLWLIGCASSGGWSGSGGNIGDLRGKKIEVKEEKIEGGLEKAIAGYKKFLESTPEAEQSPEALRRLADLKIQEVEGVYDPNTKSIQYSKPGSTKVESPIGKKSGDEKQPMRESIEALEKRSAQEDKTAEQNKLTGLPDGNSMAQQVLKDDANSREAIGIYLKLLKKYPDYDRNDQVLYQLARAYGIRGQQDKAMQTLDRIVRQYPYTPLIDEVQFRRGRSQVRAQGHRIAISEWPVRCSAPERIPFHQRRLP